MCFCNEKTKMVVFREVSFRVCFIQAWFLCSKQAWFLQWASISIDCISDLDRWWAARQCVSITFVKDVDVDNLVKIVQLMQWYDRWYFLVFQKNLSILFFDRNMVCDMEVPIKFQLILFEKSISSGAIRWVCG